LAAPDLEELVEVLDGCRRAVRRERLLQLVDADHLRHAARQERRAVSGGELALPGVGPDLEGLAEGLGDTSLTNARILLVHRRRWRQLEHPLVADDDRGRGAELRDVPLPPADD